MTPITKQITVGTKVLGFHLASGNYNLDTKTLIGTIMSFIDDTISNNLTNGRPSVAQVKQFKIVNPDATNLDKALSDYVTANIDTIVTNNSNQIA